MTASNAPPRLCEEGYVIVPDAIDSEAIATLREQLDPYLQGELMGRNDFEGELSERVGIQAMVGYSLVAGTFVGYVDGRHPAKLIPKTSD